MVISKQYPKIFLIIFLIIASLSFNYPFVKLLIWSAIALGVSLINRRAVFIFLAGGGMLQALIGFYQFAWQKSLGVYFLGESVLDSLNGDLARTFLGEGQGLLIRAYGTFPHPNILAAFLLLSLLSLYYFFITDYKFKNLLIAAIFINWLGLVLTFSRAGWMIGVAVSLIFIFWKKLWHLGAVVLISLTALILIFNWAVFPRLTELSLDNFSVQRRIGDYERAWEAIKVNPWLGSGLTLTMGEEPIHNFYLLVAMELGILGLLALLFFVGSLFLRAGDWERKTATLMLFSLLLFGLFDHFLWTLRPGIGMFWLAIGMLL